MASRTITINIHDADSSTVTVDGSKESPLSWLMVQVTEEKEINVFLTVEQLRALAHDLLAEADRRDAMPVTDAVAVEA